MKSPSTENFIKGVYQLLADKKSRATCSQLAGKLGISRAGVTDMARKLASRGVLMYQPYKALNLTPTGTQMALQILRRHRLWELFLAQVLKLSWSEVHAEAERLEHVTSDLLLEKLDDYLGRPSFDVHGDPIPDKHGVLPDTSAWSSLDQATIGSDYTIRQLPHMRDDWNALIQGLDLKPGIRLRVIQHILEQKQIEIEINQRPVRLDHLLAEQIHVTIR